MANEILLYGYSNFPKGIPADLKENALSDPTMIAGYLNENIKIAESENYYRVPVTSGGVLDLKAANAKSKDISPPVIIGKICEQILKCVQ